MIIGFEAQRIFRTHKHGMDFVALELIRSLQKIDKENKYIVFTNEGPDRACLSESDNLQIVSFKGSFAKWEQVLLPKYVGKYNCDILHCTSNTAPVYSRVPVVVTLHDIIFLEHNPLFAKGYNSYQRFGNYYRRLVVRANLSKVRKIVTVSNFEKKRLLDFLNLPNKLVDVVYNGVGAHFYKAYDAADREKVSLQHGLPQKYMLFLGNTDPKKNTKNVILAFANFVNKTGDDIKLVVADLEGSSVRSILNEAGLDKCYENIHFTGYINNEHLPAIIQGAEVFLYPSKRESFGIPILEAMACGVPVITSEAASMPEVSGGAAYLVNPLEINSIEKGIKTLHEDEELRKVLSEKGKVRAQEFKWEDSASQMLKIYKEILE